VLFSSVWSGFVVQSHSYGGDSRLSQFGGTLLFFCLSLLPLLIASLLIVLLPLEILLVRKKRIKGTSSFRFVAASVVIAAVLAGLAIQANSDLWIGAVVCGVVSSIAGAFGYERILSGSRVAT
jgi:hypothetical protein